MGYGGRTITKNIRVINNTPDRHVLNLTVTGNVEKFVTIVPRRLSLRGFAGDEIKATVKIIPEEKFPFKIAEVKAANDTNIHYKLEEIKHSKKMEYLLTVENLKKNKGRYFDTVKLKTDSKIRPEIKIHVYGYILEKPQDEKK